MKWYAISPFVILSVALITATLEDDMASLEKDLSKAELIYELENEFASASKDAHTKFEKKYRERFDAIVKKKADAERLLNQDISTLKQKNVHTKIEKKDRGQVDAIVKKKADTERPLNQDISTLKQKNDDKLDILQRLVNAIHDSKVKNDDGKLDILQLLDNVIHDSKVKNDETCKDVWKKSVCDTRAKSGYCTNLLHQDRMRLNCALTCGYCEVTQSFPAKCSLTKYGCCWDRNTTKDDDAGSNCPRCVDNTQYIFCRRFKTDCMKDNGSGELMRRKCRKTCNVCDGGCFDADGKKYKCSVWKDIYKWCEKRPETMRFFCPKTCGMC